MAGRSRWFPTPGGSGQRLAVAAVLGVTLLMPWRPSVAGQPVADRVAILVYDASGSMWGALPGGATKVEVAREVIGDFFISRDPAVPLGVIAYGYNRRGDCADIQVIADVGINDPAGLSSRLNGINPRGMTPITKSLSLAASMIPATAESADIILVTDGLETCDADPCALAAQLAQEGIAIRAHVVGFGLTAHEAAAMACVADATGGQLLTPQTGQELADALDRIAAIEPAAEPGPVQDAFFDIGPKAEAGFTYTIAYHGTAQNSDFAGFTPRGQDRPPASASFGPIGGTPTAPNNPFTKQAPSQPGEYDLILFKSGGAGIVARQAIDVVPASTGFDAIGSVEPHTRFEFTWRGPDRESQRIVIARPGDPADTYHGDWGFALHKSGRMGLRAPAEPGMYELRYLSANRKEVLFFRPFGVGIPYEDASGASSLDLAAQAAAATQAAPGQDALPMVRASFRIPDDFPQIPLWWSAVPLDADMSPEAWTPIAETIVAEGEFEPGRYQVSAQGPGELAFKDIVEIVPGQANSFVIALDEAQAGHEDADGFAEPAVVVCSDQPTGCRHVDAQTRLSLVVPDGWSMTQPIVYETAAGVVASVASATLFRAIDGGMLVIELNPRQWSAARGVCLETGEYRLCHDEADSTAMRTALAVLMPSLGSVDP